MPARAARANAEANRSLRIGLYPFGLGLPLAVGAWKATVAKA